MYYTVLAFIDYGGHSPCTPSGRAFLIIYGMGLFVISSSYTAELASFLISAIASGDGVITNIGDMSSRGIPACMDYDPKTAAAGSQYQLEMIRTGNPTLNLEYIKPFNIKKAAAAIRSGECKGALVLKPHLDLWRRPEDCDILEAGPPAAILGAGWLTNKGSPCVSACIDYWLQYARDAENKLAVLLAKWQDLTTTCPTLVTEENLENSRISLEQMSGIFGTYIVVAVLCCLGKFGHSLVFSLTGVKNSDTGGGGPETEDPHKIQQNSVDWTSVNLSIASGLEHEVASDKPVEPPSKRPDTIEEREALILRQGLPVLQKELEIKCSEEAALVELKQVLGNLRQTQMDNMKTIETLVGPDQASGFTSCLRLV